MSEKPRRATATEAIHGVKHDEQFHSVPYPIYQSANFAVEQSDDYRHYINDDLDDFYIYSRPDSPTQRAVELKLAKLEHGEDALMTASGMAAITTAVLSVVKAGDTIAASKRIYGTTYGFLANIAPQFGIQTVFLDDEALYDIEHHAPQAKLVYFETPINPTVDIVDIAAVVEAARKIGALTMLDSTFASPINQNPLDWGVDVVVHSATKYLGGHSDLVAGAIIGGETQVQAARNLLKVFGGISSPLVAFLLDRSLKTLPLRVQQHNHNALQLAKFLQSAPQVQRVYYPGLPDHPRHELAKQQMRGFGGMLSFELPTLEAAKTFADSLQVACNASSLGAVETLISLPILTSHAFMTPQERAEAGIADGLVRVSVGLEDIDDLITDFEQALIKAAGR